VSEGEFWDLLPREFYRRLAACSRRAEREEDAAWGRSLMVVNHVRALINVSAGKGSKLRPITLERLKRGAEADPGAAPSRAEWEADLRRLEELRKRRQPRPRA